MKPLPQQLEDKKKGCGCSLRIVDLGLGEELFACNKNDLCRTCKAEIAILEQAIAEIKKRDKDIDELAESSTFALCALMKENKDLKAEMQKQRQDFERILNRIIGKLEDGRNQREEIIDYCKNKKQQLNQPKTEKENSKQQLTNSEGKI